MYRFYLKCGIYLMCFLFSLYGLSALDFNRFIKKGRVAQANTLYILLALIMGYLCGEFLMAINYYFSV